MSQTPPEDLESLVVRANSGDREALESVVRAVQPRVYGLALRFLWHPEDAEDATQEILIKVVTNLASFRGESRLTTWVYRVACNALSTLRQGRMERMQLSFEALGEDLGRGLSDAPLAIRPDVEEALLLEEVKIGCTLAMLLCLDRDHRLAYILGEILEFDHNEASAALGTTPVAYRKRLSRAREEITAFMKARCGLATPERACRCRRRVATAVSLGRVDPDRLLFASSAEQARRFPEVLGKIRSLEEAQRAAALYRSHPDPIPARDIGEWVRHLIEGPDSAGSA